MPGIKCNLPPPVTCPPLTISYIELSFQDSVLSKASLWDSASLGLTGDHFLLAP